MTTEPPLSRRPIRHVRAALFAAGAIIGAITGFLMVATGHGPMPSLLEPASLAWILGTAAIFGGVAAFSPRRMRRRARRAVPTDRKD